MPRDNRPSKKGRYDKTLTTARKMALASTIGLVLVISIFIGYGVGSWLDSKLGTDPWLMLVCTLLGIVAGFHELIALARKISED